MIPNCPGTAGETEVNRVVRGEIVTRTTKHFHHIMHFVRCQNYGCLGAKALRLELQARRLMLTRLAHAGGTTFGSCHCKILTSSPSSSRPVSRLPGANLTSLNLALPCCMPHSKNDSIDYSMAR
jgi:hypothetical protein